MTTEIEIQNYGSRFTKINCQVAIVGNNVHNGNNVQSRDAKLVSLLSKLEVQKIEKKADLYITNCDMEMVPIIINWMKSKDWRGRKLLIECNKNISWSIMNQRGPQIVKDLLDSLPTLKEFPLVCFHFHINMGMWYFPRWFNPENFKQLSTFLNSLFENKKIKELVLPFVLLKIVRTNLTKNLEHVRFMAISTFDEYQSLTLESGFMNNWNPQIFNMRIFQVWRNKLQSPNALQRTWIGYNPHETTLENNSFCGKIAAKLKQTNYQGTNRKNAVITLLLIYYCKKKMSLNKLSKDMLLYVINKIPSSKEWPKTRRKPGELQTFKIKRKIHKMNQELKWAKNHLETFDRSDKQVDVDIEYLESRIDALKKRKIINVGNKKRAIENVGKMEKDIQTQHQNLENIQKKRKLKK